MQELAEQKKAREASEQVWISPAVVCVAAVSTDGLRWLRDQPRVQEAFRFSKLLADLEEDASKLKKVCDKSCLLSLFNVQQAMGHLSATGC